MPAQQKKHAGSTQKFTDIQDIIEDIVLFHGGNACLVIEIQASNFALLSSQEQQAKIYGYASLLNSLSFHIQIIIQNKKIDLTSYLQLLDQALTTTATVHPTLSPTQNQQLLTQIQLYKGFIQELIKVNTVLDKKFYIVIPYSPLEKGLSGAAPQQKNAQADTLIGAKAALHNKASSLLSQLARISLRAKVLGTEELVKLFYELYNENESTLPTQDLGTHIPLVKGVPA